MRHRETPVKGEDSGERVVFAGYAAYHVIMKLANETTGRSVGGASDRKIESLIAGYRYFGRENAAQPGIQTAVPE